MYPPFLKHLGNTFILLSLTIFLVLGYPLAKVYLFPTPYVQAETPHKEFYLAIPKIKASSPVVENVDPWKQAAYQEALKHGVAHASTSALPGEGKTVFLFAHSSGMPWDQMYNNTIFLRLGELTTGDKILIDRNKKRYTYAVVDKKEVWPNEVSYLKPQNENQLILQTCTPIGTSLKRLLIFAELER